MTKSINKPCHKLHHKAHHKQSCKASWVCVLAALLAPNDCSGPGQTMMNVSAACAPVTDLLHQFSHWNVNNGELQLETFAKTSSILLRYQRASLRARWPSDCEALSSLKNLNCLFNCYKNRRQNTSRHSDNQAFSLVTVVYSYSHSDTHWASLMLQFRHERIHLAVMLTPMTL